MPVIAGKIVRWLPLLALTLAMPTSSPTRAAAPASASDDGVLQKVAEVEAEIAALRKSDADPFPSAARYADALSSDIEPLRAALAGADAMDGKSPDTATPELYVVGFYQGSMPNGPKKYGAAVVELAVTDRPVVLALCAYEPVRWELRLAKGVRLERLIVAGYGEQILEPAPPATVAVEKHVAKAGDDKAFYVFPGGEEDSTPRASEKLRALTGLPITTLQGANRYPGEPVVVGPRDGGWRRQRVMARLKPLWREATAMRRSEVRQATSRTRFRAIRWIEGGRPMQPAGELAEFTPLGWVEGTGRTLPERVNQVAADPGGPTWYGIGDRWGPARLDLDAGAAAEMEVKQDVPEFHWPRGIAFDTKRKRLIVVAQSYLYAYDPPSDTWSVLRDVRGLDGKWASRLVGLQSLVYSEEDDSLYGLTGEQGGRGRLRICQLRPDGQPVRELEVKAEVSVDPMVALRSPSQVVLLGRQFAVLMAPPISRDPAVRRPRAPGVPGVGGGQAKQPPMKCLLVDAATGEVTYSGEMGPIAAPDAQAAAADPANLRALWDAVVEATPADADEAVRALAGRGDAAVAAIRMHMPAAPPPPDAAALRALLSRLDGEDWKGREEAAARLAGSAGVTEPQLREALAGARSAEARQRLDGVLKTRQLLRDRSTASADVDKTVGDPSLRARLRAVRALGRIGTPAAARLLREMAGGPPGTVDVERARVALAEL